jgi:hypothetical protein
MSSAAKKAWATRRKKNPKKWRKRERGVFRPAADTTVSIVRNGKVERMKESQVPPHTTIYHSTWEAEQVAKNPKWYLKKEKK